MQEKFSSEESQLNTKLLQGVANLIKNLSKEEFANFDGGIFTVGLVREKQRIWIDYRPSNRQIASGWEEELKQK